MMTDEQRSERGPDQRKIFQIKIQGHLSEQWMHWFDGLSITLEGDGTTLLGGPVVDQAALHGILKKIRNLGMPLLSVNSVENDPVTRADTNHVKGDV